MTVYSSETALEGKVVRSPSQERRSPPRTEYVYVQDKGSGGGQQRGWLSYNPRQSQQARVPSGVPPFLGNRAVIFGTWAVSMALVGADEWRTNHILPRPLRLWETTLVFAGLAILSMIDAMVPLANAFAIGYTIVLLYQFFTGGGNFGGPGV
jgi:hypothetical protein